jgi:hypothetical protein
MRMLLQNGITPDQEDVYSTPDLTQMAINHWINNDAIKDKKDYEAGLAEEKSKNQKKMR